MLAHGCIDSGDPKPTENTLTVTTVAISVLTSAHDRLLGDPKDVFTTTTVSLGKGKNFLVTGTGRDATFDSGHEELLELKKRR
jgi:hypothetical protein